MLSEPKPLNDTHALDGFRCTEVELENWLKQRARKNQHDGASRCFVVCDGTNVVGYYALAAGSVTHAQVPGNIRRNMPEPIPVVVLGRLAVHADYAGQGIGAGLLKNAVLRSLRLAREMGVRALLCHAISEDAKRFYLHHGFVESPIEPMMVMLNLARLADTEPGH
ncbi:MAG: GNAT family N-acetyltransferase [Burkholderiales bacterium]|nr:GNAT family N-acetyltransferase [Burkholderiales bacterium]